MFCEKQKTQLNECIESKGRKSQTCIDFEKSLQKCFESNYLLLKNISFTETK